MELWEKGDGMEINKEDFTYKKRTKGRVLTKLSGSWNRYFLVPEA
jgi:hypothetical protein